MEPDSREEKNALAFIEHLTSACGYTLRPPSYLTLEYVGLLGLTFGRRADGAAQDADPARSADEVHAYLFIQAAPFRTVSRGIRSYRAELKTVPREEAFENFLADHVEPFLAALTPEVKAELAEQLGQMDEVSAAQIDAMPPPSPGGKTQRHDPNSSSQGVAPPA